MTYTCDECGKSYKWRDSLTRHNRVEHQVGNGKRTGSDSESEDSIPRKYSSLKRSKTYSLDQEEDVQELKRSDAMPDTHFVDSRNYKPTQVHEFKFKHPFCMMVCGPSRSGKTKWVAKLLKNRYEMIDTAVDSILYCYAHWQPTYAEVKIDVSGITFQRGLPSEQELEEMNDCLIVIDDLMNEAVKDPSLLNAFTEGSHHKNISVVFLMQNIYHKGPHAKT
jgi:hypothetical protein